MKKQETSVFIVFTVKPMLLEKRDKHQKFLSECLNIEFLFKKKF